MPRLLAIATLCCFALAACSDSVEEPLDVGTTDVEVDSRTDTGSADAADAEAGSDSDVTTEDTGVDAPDDATDVEDADSATDVEDADAATDVDAETDTPDDATTGTASVRLLVTSQTFFDRSAPFVGNVLFGGSPAPVSEYQFGTLTAPFDVDAGEGQFSLNQSPLGDFAGGAIYQSDVVTLEEGAQYAAILMAPGGQPEFLLRRVDDIVTADNFAQYIFVSTREDVGTTDLITFLTPREPALIAEDLAPGAVFEIALPRSGADLGADYDGDIAQIDGRFLLDEVAEGTGPRFIIVDGDSASRFDFGLPPYSRLSNANPPSQLRYLIPNVLPGDNPVDAYAFQPGLENLWPIGRGLAPGFISTVPVPTNQSTLRLGLSPYDGSDDDLILETIQNNGSEELGELLVVPWQRDDGSFDAVYGSMRLAVPVANVDIHIALGTEVSAPLNIYQRRATGSTFVDDNGNLLLNDRVALLTATRDDNAEIRLLLQPDDAAGPDYIADLTPLAVPGENLICIALDDDTLRLLCGTRGRLTDVPLTVAE